MSDLAPLADVLTRYLKARRWTFEDLAEEAGLPRNTVYRWTQGEVRKVRHWQDLARAAAALRLSRFQTNRLLRSTRQPPVEELLERAKSDEARELLARWAVSAPNNLPDQLTSFVGRDEEIESVTELLSSARLVTLTGAPGSGKTRLAVQVAEAVLDRFPDGVFFAGLAPIRDEALVIPAIARVLDVRTTPGEPPIEALRTYLEDKRVLLLLDNFEQVVDAAPLVADLLSAAPRVKALVTSRARLCVRGEHDYVVLPFALPDAGGSLEEMRANPAVTLFAERARTANPEFALTPENALLVAEICRRLDGLPLAIELAAARVRRFSVRAILERFASRLDLGDDGPRDLPARQRTLRSTISWSHDLLGPEEERLFRRLAVFSGGCPEDAAVAVANLPGEEALDVSAALGTLADANLLRQVPGVGDERRFAMLETIREYALELLEESGELEAAQRAHAGYYLRMAETAEPEWDGPLRRYWLDRLELELDNLRAALRWCTERGEVLSGLRLSTALMFLWQVHDHHSEGSRWLETFTASDCAVPPDLRAKALLWHGLLLMRYAGDVSAAEPLIDRALAGYRESGDLSGACQTIQAQGDAAFKQGQIAAARDRFMESLDLAEQAGDDYLAARSCLKIALCAQEDGDFATAQRSWERSLAMARVAGIPARIASALNGLGEAARGQGDLETARCYYEQGLELARATDSEWGVAMALHNLGCVACHSGQHERALALFSESLSLHAKRQVRQGIGECLAGLAHAAIAQGHAERAARLCGASEAVLESIASRLEMLERMDYEHTLAMLRDTLPAERLDALLAEGRSLSMECAVEYAMEGYTSPA